MENITNCVRASKLFHRYDHNPILTSADWPYPANSVFNAAAVQLDGETLLLIRVEGLRGFSHLTAARSKNGITDWKIDPQPTFSPDPESNPEEIWGVEDPRIVWLEEKNEYAVTYTSFSQGGPLVSLAMTKDFHTFRRIGPIMPPENKDASLLPRRFGERWALIHRPMPGSQAEIGHMWLSFSPDLKHWGDHQIIIKARHGGWWDANKIGLGPQPIETPEGWLVIYHGVRRTASSSIYRLGLALLDLDDPRKLIRRSNEWVFGPKEIYELIGDVPCVTFPCGAVLDQKTNELRLYYGAADTTIGLATANMSELLEYLKSSPNPSKDR